MSILYHPSNSNVVADALTRLSMGGVSYVEEEKRNLVKDFHMLAHLGVRIETFPNGDVVVHHDPSHL